MLKRISITFLLCFISFAAFGQIDDSKASEGSIYSKFGVGLPVDYGSSSADGMGLWGVSFSESLVPGIANPAHWGNTVYGMASGGLKVDNYSAKDNFGSATHSLIAVNNFQLQLPLLKGKLGLSASFTPLTESNYEIFQTGEQVLTGQGTRDTLNFQTVNVGDGGINQLEVGVGWRIHPNIALGYAASLVYASLDDQYTTVFDDNSYRTVNTTFQTSGTGMGNRFGAFFTFPGLALEDDLLSLGLTLRLPVTIDGERIRESTYVSSDPNVEDSEIESRLGSGDITIPLGLTAGLTYEPSQRLAFTTEGRYEQWSNYENELTSPSAGTRYSDRVKIGVGMKYFPFLSGSDKFLSQFKYRFGATYDSGHLKINGENIETLKLSAGLGILSPTRVSGFRSSVDLSLYYGIRGTTTQNLVKENIWGVKLSLNLAELFFYRPKLQ